MGLLQTMEENREERKEYGGELDDEDLELLEEKIEDLEDQGWTLMEGKPNRVEMRYFATGSLLVHVILLIFTVGIGNILYAGFRFARSSETRIVRPETEI